MSWMTKDWTQGDLNAIVKKLGGEKIARGILTGTVRFTTTPVEQTASPESKGPGQFFGTRSGLWVSDNFQTLVVAKAEPASAVETRNFDLPRAMTDTEVESSLGDGHIFTEGELCSTLQALIEEQWGGKSGKLLNNGYANLFYTRSCVVRAYWHAGSRERDVSTWQRDDSGWDAGYRAFSPATGT